MTNILIPSNLSPASLSLAEKAIQCLEPRNANIILFHAFEFPYSEFELLRPGRKMPYADAMNDEFRQACKQLKDQNLKAVQGVFFKFIEGGSARMFRNFVDANEIDLIVCPDEYIYTPINKLSVDPRPLFRKAGIPVVRELPVQKNRVVIETIPFTKPGLAMAQ